MVLSSWVVGRARRKFDEELRAQNLKTPKQKNAPLAADAMRRIKLLYQIERKIKNGSTEQRHAIRQQRSLPVLNDFRKWLDKHLLVVPPKSALGEAISYADKQRPKLTTYTLDGRLRIDNDLTENAIWPFVIGRKNWLFCDSVAGAKASANPCSLIETEKANKIEPYRY